MKKVLGVSLVLILVLSIFSLGCSSTKQSEKQVTKYPGKQITITVGYAAGGAADLMAREMGKFISKKTGQSVIVVNKPGGGGSTAIAEVVGKAPDGYNIAMVSNGGLLINPYLNNLGFTYDKVTPLAQTVDLPVALAIKADSQFKTLEDVLNFAQKNPGKLTFASAGVNSTPHLIVEKVAFDKGNGTKLNLIPNTNTPQSISELLGGHIDLFSINSPSVKSYYDAKSLRVLAITGKERNPMFPDVPTYKEQGFDNLDAYSAYFGFVAPQGTPPEVVKELDNLFKAACVDPETIAAMKKINQDISFLDSKAFTQRLNNDMKTYKDILDKLGVKKQ